MTVEDPGVVDTVARMPEGRYLLVMTEHRFYRGADAETMLGQLVAKLNAYVHLIRSGGLVTMIGPDVQRGVDIELSCRDEPPARIREAIRLAAQGLEGEGVGVAYRVMPPPEPAAIYDVIGPALIAAAPAGWQRIDLTATLIGDGMTGGLTATGDDGARTPLPPPEWLPDALGELKRAFWEPEHGTWVTFRVEVAGRSLQPRYEFDEPPGGAAEFRREDWAEELRRYPRTTVPAWWQAQLG